MTDSWSAGSTSFIPLDCDITHAVIKNQYYDDVIMMSHMTSHMMSYKMAVSNNRGFYGTLLKNILKWGTQYSELCDPSIFNPLFWDFIHKNTILTINSPLCSTLSGVSIIIIIFHYYY